MYFLENISSEYVLRSQDLDVKQIHIYLLLE